MRNSSGVLKFFQSQPCPCATTYLFFAVVDNTGALKSFSNHPYNLNLVPTNNPSKNMIKKTSMQRWLPDLMAAAALAGSLGLSHAQSLVSYTFDSDIQAWDAGGNGSVVWNSTNGTSGGGCLAVTFDGTTSTETDPGVAVSVNTAQYFTVELDMMIDPASGTTGVGGSGGYGALQMVMRDSGGSWDSSWYGTLYSPAANSYQHYKFVIARPYKTEARLQFQLSSFGNAYSGPVTAYIDNVQIKPVL